MELFSFLLSIAFYVFTSLGYYRISESLGLGNSWMTFVPIVNLFKIGEISDTLRGLQNKPDKKRRIVLPVASIVSGFVMGIALFLSFLMIGIAAEVEKELQRVHKPITVAVMGCAVNGPGEAKEADIGIACGKGEGLIFKRGEILYKVKESQLADKLIEEIEKMTGEKV